MIIKEGEYIFIIVNNGYNFIINEGVVIKINDATLIIRNEDILTEYYPKQKNIHITKTFETAKLIFLAKKLKNKSSCDKNCLDDIMKYTKLSEISKIYQDIENSKIQYPELWI